MARPGLAAAWIIPGIVLGFVLGGLGPRSELQSREDELSRLEDQLIKAQRRAERRSPLSVMGLDRAMQAPAPAPAPPPPEAPDRDEEEAGDLTIVEEAPEAVPPSEPPPDMLEEFGLAVEAQRVRARQSRQALIDQADLGDVGVGELDAVIEEMNERLARVAADAVEMADPSREPDSADMLRVTHEVSGILYDAQLGVDDVIGDEAVETVEPSAREVWNHIDLEGFRGAVEEADARWGDDGAWDGGR